MKGFSEEVYRLTSQIPEGKVSTYGAIARAMGIPKAPRAVGAALRANPKPVVVPCHRVVKSDGSLGGYSSPLGLKRKVELLRGEGVTVSDGTIDLGEFLFSDFR